MEIVLSGEGINAEHAYRIGLVNRVYSQAAEAGLEALQPSDNWFTL